LSEEKKEEKRANAGQKYWEKKLAAQNVLIENIKHLADINSYTDFGD